ncbi:hypothetical protein EV664_102267 [Stakelama pacifica]|uniref:Uncharacterized protein n=1 Tax=Stakelama pacifica TaxID=517720 RepID=A0A4R6FW86_9SPHN|nr:hypothetical protein EV664_102267 [Stakelama pacifica]
MTHRSLVKPARHLSEAEARWVSIYALWYNGALAM